MEKERKIGRKGRRRDGREGGRKRGIISEHRTGKRKREVRRKKGWVKRNKLVEKTNSFLFKAPSIDNFFPETNSASC